MSKLIRVVYITGNAHKQAENEILLRICKVGGKPVRDRFSFDLRPIPVKEVLEVDLALMVAKEAQDAYRKTKEPCVVEHAGLIFEGYSRYPGGLTKPMWDELGSKFLEETHSAGKRAIARAVVGYCDGQKVELFTGETNGTIADSPKGSREFYWDTVFIPDTTEPRYTGKTYAEVASDAAGLEFKVEHLSQSTKAMRQFLEYRLNNKPELWPHA